MDEYYGEFHELRSDVGNELIALVPHTKNVNLLRSSPEVLAALEELLYWCIIIDDEAPIGIMRSPSPALPWRGRNGIPTATAWWLAKSRTPASWMAMSARP